MRARRHSAVAEEHRRVRGLVGVLVSLEANMMFKASAAGSRSGDDSERADTAGDEESDDEDQLAGGPALHGGSGDKLVEVTPPTTYHTSWEAWIAYFATYCASTMQVLPVRETMSRAERNRRLSKTKKGADESVMVPEGLDPYSRVYICTHGWKKRKSRGSGSRPRQHIRLTDCPFRFTVQWNLSRLELQVKNGCFKHNHPISSSAFATYHSSRGVVDPLVDARVEGMLSVGAKRSKIYDYLLEHDQNVILVDVDNLVRGHNSSVSKIDDDDATAREIAAFAAADPENVSSVAETAAGETGVISLATAHMRRIYGRFSELLLVDCSHKTNRYNYQLLTFMTMNEFGEGAVVQQSLLEANSDWHMEKAVSHFRRMHPTRIEQLRVVVVDKDLNEIKVLESNFPKARVLVCHFHVIKYLKEKRAKPEYGKISADDASQVDAAVHGMVYADCEEKYRLSHESFQGICDRVGLHDFFVYFEKNWDRSQDRWVLYKRASLPHFKNHTNNRLENFFGKPKDSVDGKMSMAGCVKALLAYDRRKENEYRYRLHRIGRQINTNYDEEMSNVLRFTSHFVAEEIAEQYTKALANAGRYKFTVVGEGDGQVVVQSSKKTYRVRLDNWECDCEFSMTMKLPCRHAIAYRKHEVIPGPAIPWMRINPRIEVVILPLNFSNAHWCCVVVSVLAKRIFYYDPLHQTPYLNSAMAIATHLKISGLQEYDVIAQNNPIQFDAFSCGVYVCWMFIRHVAKGPPLDMSAAVLPRRRFELFYYLLSGRLLTKEGFEHKDDEEANLHAPPVAGSNEDEDLPATQVAQ